MAVLNGLLSKLTGSAGSLTFKRVKGKTIVSEKVTTTSNMRTKAQMMHRLRWPNIIKMYSGIAPLLNYAFENKAQGMSDYNVFVQKNFANSNVYMTKGEAAANSCIAAPYQISDGSLDNILVSGEAGASVTDIQLGALTITDTTTVKEFSNAVVTNNRDYNYGDQISFIRVVQVVNAISGNPQAKFYAECVVLDRENENALRVYASAAGFSAKEGKLACSLGEDFQGAYAWIHSRLAAGGTQVSSQVLVVKNDLLEQYSGEDAYQRAVATYGGETSAFLTPDAGSAAVDLPSGDSTPVTPPTGGNDNTNPGGGTPGGGSNQGGGSGDDGDIMLPED